MLALYNISAAQKNLHFLVVFIPVINRRHPRNFFESSPKSLRVRITYVIHHFIDIFAARFKALFGGFDFYSLDIFRDGVVRGSFESAFKRAATDGEH